MSTTTLNPDVARGIAWLDEEVPGWRDRINPRTLDMRDPRHCILGQVFAGDAHGTSGYWHVVLGDYESKRYPERTAAERVTGTSGFAHTHGFDLSYDAGYDALTAEWREVLAAS